MTREGTVFRVDVRLRPSGSKGPLCQSIEAFAMYIKGHADIWELQSLTRARIIAGDESLGSEFMTMTHELVYNPPLLKGEIGGLSEEKRGLNLSTSIRAMRRRMEAEVSKEDSEHYDIKVGPGGIVDIEFMVQYLQLLHGSKYPGLRVTHTLLALESLHREGLLSKDRYLRLRRSLPVSGITVITKRSFVQRRGKRSWAAEVLQGSCQQTLPLPTNGVPHDIHNPSPLWSGAYRC